MYEFRCLGALGAYNILSFSSELLHVLVRVLSLFLH